MLLQGRGLWYGDLVSWGSVFCGILRWSHAPTPVLTRKGISVCVNVRTRTWSDGTSKANWNDPLFCLMDLAPFNRAENGFLLLLRKTVKHYMFGLIVVCLWACASYVHAATKAWTAVLLVRGLKYGGGAGSMSVWRINNFLVEVIN